MDDKIIELEIRITYQDKLIAELDSVVCEFTKRLQTLERHIADLRESASGLSAAVGPGDEPPPHY